MTMSSNENDVLLADHNEDNPNNMIVSDVLKGRLPDEFYEEILEKDQDIRIVLTGGNDYKAFLKLTSTHETEKGWSLIGVTTKINALKLMKTQRAAWTAVAIMYGSTEVVKEMKVNTDKFKIGIDFPDANIAYSSECIVTLSCLEE